MDEADNGYPVTTCMDVNKAYMQSDVSLEKLKLRIVVRGDFQNNEMIGDTWAPTAPMRTLKYSLSDASKHKARVHQLNLIGAFLQASVKHIVLRSLTVNMENTSQSMATILEDH